MGQVGFSFQADGKEQGGFVPALLRKVNNKKIYKCHTSNHRWRFCITVTLHHASYLVDVLCKSVGVLLAEVRAGGAGALSRGPAEGVAATSLIGADRGPLSGGDLTWLPVHGPGGAGD